MKKKIAPQATLWTVWCLSGHKTTLNTPFIQAHMVSYHQCGTHKYIVGSVDVPLQRAEQHKSRLLMVQSHSYSVYFSTPSKSFPPPLSPRSLSCPSVRFQALAEHSDTHILSGNLACCCDIQCCQCVCVCLCMCV